MHKNRLEAFSDGVIAIIITIMVLEFRPPHGAALADLRPLLPVFLGYVLSFVFLGIYWNNHHHMFQVVKRIGGAVLWANMHLLFWLSLVPFVTGWMGEHGLRPAPVAAYGAVLLGAAIAYTILVRTLLRHHERDSALARAIGSDTKGYISLACYAAALAVAWWLPWLSCALYVVVALIWLIPDRRMERVLGDA